MMLGVVFTRPLQRVQSEFHAAVHTLVSEYASFMRAHLITVLGNGVRTCENIVRNLPTYAAAPGIGFLKRRFVGCPAVVVSAGPSLGRNLAVLKEMRARVVVIVDPAQMGAAHMRIHLRGRHRGMT